MRFRIPLPRSLWSRVILLTLGTVLLAQAATLATVSYYRERFTETVTVQITATTIRTLRAALAEIPAEERDDFVRSASQNEWHLWSRRLPSSAELQARRSSSRADAPPPRNDLRRELRSFVRALNLTLDDGTRVGLSRGASPRLYISLLPDSGLDPREDREWLVVPLDKLSPPVATPAIIAWLAGMGALLLLAGAFSWHITRPLTRLARAADQLASGQPQRVIPSGPRETRILGERFNAMLDALSESEAVRRTLLAGLPHDLKGPLSRMWLRIEMMDSDAGLKEGLRNDVQDMQRMVNQFIGFVRGSDPATYQLAPLDLGVWLEEQVAAWESTGSAVSLRTGAPSGMVLHADRLALARLLDNLITNALNHGAPPVKIGLYRDNDVAVITVSDQGPGISEDRRHEAMRPFSRLDEARTRTGSVGLGLALCEAIARAHRGSIALGSARCGGGLEVTVRLPLASKEVGVQA